MKPSAPVRGIHLGIFIVIASFFLLAATAVHGDCLPEVISDAIAFLSACPYRALTHSPCPLCGGLTASIALLCGDLDAARAANRFAIAVLPLLSIQFAYRLFRILKPKFSWKEESLVLAGGIGLGAFMSAV